MIPRDEYIRELYKELKSCRKVAEHLATEGVHLSRRAINDIVLNMSRAKVHKEKPIKPTKPSISGAYEALPPLLAIAKKFIITAAQNNTTVHADFFKSILTYARENNAQVLVAPFTYNKKGFQNASSDDESLTYDPAVTPYLFNQRLQLTEGLTFFAELDILPTAVNPLSDLESFCRGGSGIVPHTKTAMQSLPRLVAEHNPRFLYSTGACTMYNYIQRKAGQKAEFHHSFGALVVEVADDGTWFVRQVIADEDGGFYDIDTYYSPTGSRVNTKPSILVWGDIHIPNEDKNVVKVTRDLVKEVNARTHILHDVLDFNTRNHHNIKDRYHKMAVYNTTVQEELTAVKTFVNSLLDPVENDVEVFIIDSNHNNALLRWVKDLNGVHEENPQNALLWHSLNMVAIQYTLADAGIALSTEVLKVALGAFPSGVYFVPVNTTLQKDTVELSMHGHNGVNGARGGPQSLKKVAKACVGHSHSASIVDGLYTVGTTSKMNMGYNVGPTTWSHTHCVIYPNGKRTLITIVNNKWRA